MAIKPRQSRIRVLMISNGRAVSRISGRRSPRRAGSVEGERLRAGADPVASRAGLQATKAVSAFLNRAALQAASGRYRRSGRHCIQARNSLCRLAGLNRPLAA